MIFENCTILTMDGRRRIVAGGAIAVREGRIAAVGKQEAVRSQFPGDLERVDLGGMLVLPGLVNTHVHLSQALIRGCADDLSLVGFLNQRVWVLQGNYDQEDGRLSAELCLLEMLKSGTTSFVESMTAHRYGFDGIARAVERSGMRAALSKIVMDRPSYAMAENSMHPGMIEGAEESFAEALELHARWHGAAEGRIQVWFGPRPPGGTSTATLRRLGEAVRERGMRLTIHLAEVRDDIAYIRGESNLPAVEYAKSVGLLGPNILLIHMVWVGPEEISLLAETGTHVTHNPLSNSKLASGIAPIPEMLQAGVNVGLGTDAATCSNDYDMVRAMRWASFLHKARCLDPEIMPCETVLEMATLNGAKAMGLEGEIGSLEVGKRADFIALDMNKPHLTPAPNPVSALVSAATGKDVDTVVIGGKVVVQGGRCLTLDEERILAEARERAKSLYRRAGLEIKPKWPVE